MAGDRPTTAEPTGTNDDADDGAVDAAPDSLLRTYLAATVTLVALVAFAALVVYLFIDATESSERSWNRRIYLLSGVEAIAFAAVGWLFGKEVHRREANTAQKRAAKAEQRADGAAGRIREKEVEAVKERERGHALQQAVLCAAGTRGEPGGPTTRGSADPLPASAGAEIATLAEFARRLYRDDPS